MLIKTGMQNLREENHIVKYYSGRLIPVTTPENIDSAHDVILTDRRIRLKSKALHIFMNVYFTLFITTWLRESFFPKGFQNEY